MNIYRQLTYVKSVSILAFCFVAFIGYHGVAYGQCGGTGGGTPPPGCPGAVYRPSAYDDLGTDDTSLGDGYIATTSPSGPETGANIGTAPVSGSFTAQVNAGDFYAWDSGTWDDYPLVGNITWSAFPNLVVTSDLTLHIPYAIAGNSSYSGDAVYQISLTIGSTTTLIYDSVTASASGEVTTTIPSGTNLSTVSVTVNACPATNYNPNIQGTNTFISESIWVDVYIQ